MKVVVSGGRKMNDPNLVFTTLNKLHQQAKITELIHGGANGADALSATWADANDVSQTAMKPDWGRYRQGAALKNNQLMIDSMPGLVVAFPGGTGTADLVRRAEKVKLKVLVISG